MKKILLVDYYGTCDSMGKPIGHSQKVLQEYSNLIKDEFVISAAVSPCLIEGIEQKFEEIIPLKYNISAQGEKTLWERIKDKFKLINNIRQILRIPNYDIIWFYRTDFFLFFYFCFRRKNRCSKIIGQIYQEKFTSGKISKILNFFYRKGAMKFNGLIYNQKGMAKFHPNTLYIPDYYYDANKYEKYKVLPKQNMAVCLGTMNPYKKLEELVDAFNVNGMKLIIKGYFYEKERYHKLIQRKKDNIIIEDSILSEDDYYQLLAQAKYSVLPYDMEQYGCRTSGVLQESLFLGTIPVAPKGLLNENRIDGIGYEKIEELTYLKSDSCVNYDMERKIPEEYKKSYVQKKLLDYLKMSEER